MNELICITYERDIPQVSGRELHEKLGVKTAYKDWFPRMCEYGFEEGIDFSSNLSESTGGRPATDHMLTLDMAKQLCMIQRSEIGRQFREYFLEIERRWNTPEAVMGRALRFAQEELNRIKNYAGELKAKNDELAPKALFADAVSASQSSILIGDLAKLLKQNGVNIGQQRLFEWLRCNGWLIKNGSSRNMPTQRALDMGLFRVKESTVTNPDGSVRVTRTTKVLGKGQTYFVNMFLTGAKVKL